MCVLHKYRAEDASLFSEKGSSFYSLCHWKGKEIAGDSSFVTKNFNSKVSQQEALVSHGNVQNTNVKEFCSVTFFRYCGRENGTCSCLSRFEFYDILVLLLDE